MSMGKDEEKRKRAPRDRDETFSGAFHDAWVKKTKPRAKEVQYAENLKKGLSLMLYVSPHGRKTWRVLFYKGGRPLAERIGAYPSLSVKGARAKAYDFDPERAIASADAGTFEKVFTDWMVDHVERKGLRTRYEIERRLRTYVLPRWKKLPIFDIKKSDVNNLLREIERKHGTQQADAVRADIHSIMKWFSDEDDHYLPVVVPIRDQRLPQDRRRHRILDDQEIRGLWKACDDLGTYGGIVKVLLLTAQRLDKVRSMRWSDLEDGVWTIQSEPREKGNAAKVRLPQLALDIIKVQPCIAGSPFVFSGTQQGRRSRPGAKRLPVPSFNSFSQHKKLLDKALPRDMAPWVLHDLRRTARTLMSRLKIPRDDAERTLGHNISSGVEETYDRFAYFEEKSDALKRLVELIVLILDPPQGSNVVPLHPQQAVAIGAQAAS